MARHVRTASFRIHALTNNLSGLGQRDAYIQPYVNFADLSWTYYLLNFLQFRAVQISDITA